MVGVNILITFLLVVLVAVEGHEFPDAFKRCQLNDKDFDKCLAKSIENAFKLIGSTGIPSLGLPSIDPIHAPKIVVEAGTGAVNLVQNYEDVAVYGFSKGKIQKAHLDLDKKILKFTAFYPGLRQEAKYKINGNILVIPVYGTGDSEIHIGGGACEHTLVFQKIIKNGTTYFHVENYKVNITDIKSAHYDFRNLFDGNKRMGDNILNVINENWYVIFQDVRDGVEKAYSAIAEAIARKFFGSIPIDEIFLQK